MKTQSKFEMKVRAFSSYSACVTACLDFENGGEIADNLFKLYEYSDTNFWKLSEQEMLLR